MLNALKMRAKQDGKSSSKYFTYIHAGGGGAVDVAGDFGSRGLGYASRLPRRGTVSLGKALHLYVHSLSPGVNEYLVG